MRNSSDSPAKPVEKHLYKHPLPKHQVFFCDTNFFIAAIIDDGTDRHKSAVKFLHRLSKAKTTLAFKHYAIADGIYRFLFNAKWNPEKIEEAVGEEREPVFGFH